MAAMQRGKTWRLVALALAVILSESCGAAAPAPPTQPVEAAAPESSEAGYCGKVRAMAGLSCRARYDCSDAAIATLRETACACLRGHRLSDVEARDSLTLLAQTRAFGCCAGIALARTNGAQCGG